MIEGLRTDSLFVSVSDIRVSQLLAALSFSAAIVLLIRFYLLGAQDSYSLSTLLPADGPLNPQYEILDSEFEENDGAECLDVEDKDDNGETPEDSDNTDSQNE